VIRRPGWIVLLVAAAACGGDTLPGDGAPLTFGVEPLASPAPPGAVFPHVAETPDGGAVVSWTEARPEGGHAVRMAVLRGGEWSEARTVATGDRFFVNWADFPSVHVLADGTMAAHWLDRSAEGRYDYDVRTAVSRDEGNSWSAPIVLHRDGIPAEHGFVSFFPQDGGFGAVWLDGRKVGAAAQAEARGEEGPLREMTLHFTVLGSDGTHSGDEVMLDGRICDCCQTAAAVTDRGPVILYRDRSENEIRDISVVRRVDGQWTEPAPLHRDGWEIPGCPVNGPQLDGRGRDLAAAWFTGAGGVPRVRAAFSSDAGATWSPPIEVDDGSPLGRVDVLLLDDGTALVVWLEAGEGETEALIRARRIHPSGARSGSADMALTAAARSSGFPRMARGDGGIVLAWTDPGEGGGVRVMRVRLDH
jgi:hypothetical protein